MSDEQKAAQDQIKAVYDDCEAEINGHKYKFTKMLFGERRAVFAYLTTIEPKVSKGDMSFLEDAKFKQIETLMFKRITHEDMSLNKLNVFEKDDAFIGDYIMLIMTAMQVISYPFQEGNNGM